MDLEKVYPEVEPFVDRMYAELWANRGKGDQPAWRTMTLKEAWVEIEWHAAKLAVAIKQGDAKLIHELSADIANGAMMLDDILNHSQVI